MYPGTIEAYFRTIKYMLKDSLAKAIGLDLHMKCIVISGRLSEDNKGHMK